MKLKTGQLVRATSKDENGYWDSRIGTVEQIECEYTGSGYVTTIWIKFEGNDSLFGYHPRFVKELNELEKIKVYHTDAIRLQEIADNKIYIIDSWYANIFADELPKIFDITTWKNDDIDLEVY